MTIGEYLIKEGNFIYQSPLDNPLLRALIGGGLGATVGGLYGYAAPEKEYLTERELRERALTGALKGGALGVGIGLVPSALGIHFGPKIKIPG